MYRVPVVMTFNIFLICCTALLLTGEVFAEGTNPVINEAGDTSHTENEQSTFSQLNEAGITAYRKKDYLKAISYYEKALDKRNNDIGALNNLALALLKQVKLDESIEVSNKVINSAKSKRQKANAYFNKGNALEKKGENILALQSYRNAHELSPSPARLEAYNRMEAIAPKRYSGTDWSEGEIIKYLKKPGLKLAERGVYKYMTEACTNMLPSIQSLDFSFIRPTIVVDDWDDIKLDPYKKKYESFKYGMGYEVHSPDVLATIPTWNIMIYDIDIDNDLKNETIMYGERTRAGTYERSYDKGSVFSLLRPEYQVFEFEDKRVYGVSRGADLHSDPQSLPNERDIRLSAVIKVQNILSVLVVSDVIWSKAYHHNTIELVLLGRQTMQRGHGTGSQKCVYDY